MPVESIKVPDLGDSKDVEVVEILVTEGQSVNENDSLLVLESDKAAMEIPSPKSGVVKSISVKLGDELSEGDEMITMEIEGAGSSAEDAGAAEQKSDAADDKAVEEKAPAKSEAKSDSGKAASKTVAESGGQSETRLIEVPDIGDDKDVEVIEVHVAVGDLIEPEDPLITLESDKAAMEVPSPAAGEVKSLKIKVGDKVSKGSAILELLLGDSAGGQASDGSAEKAATKDAKQGTEPEKGAEKAPAEPREAAEKDQSLQEKQSEYARSAAASASSKVYAGPAVRKLARELGVDLSQVEGSGSKGRVQKEDVHSFVKSRLQAPASAAGTGAGIPSVPDIDFSQFGEVEEVQMSKLHRLTAANMHRNWLNVPAVAQFNEADITDLEDFRVAQKKAAERKGVKLTLLPFLLKACAKTLQEYPQFNVSLHSSGEKLIQKKYIHIGVAVATEAGLVVPVLRNVDQKSVWQLAAELAEMTEKAKTRRLGKEDMQGACFTISSLGAIGGTSFTPIVNAPEVGILGVSKTAVKPVYMDGQFVPRKMLPLILCYDHRAVNGVDAGLFATMLADVLSDIRLLMM